MRFTRAGKSTHQRVPSEPTSWEALKSTPPKSSTGPAAKKSPAGDKLRNGNSGPKKFKRDEKGGSRGGRGKPGNKKPQRFRRGREEEVSANFVQLGNREKPEEAAEENDENGNTENAGDESSEKGKKKFVLGDNKQVKFLGMFWVSLEESKRLKALHKKLKGQGMSRKAIEVALRQERRNAEKNAKRARDKICFGCRTFGHMFSQCPERKKTEDVEGGGESAADAEVCFKCGSTEHKSRHCRKTTAKFDFATCFICSKSGHIARQCPDNSKGIYPLGGSCNLCDETTHLAKDCPTLVPEDQRGSKKDDDAIISRISNPFTSPEFEEWNLEEDKKEDTEVGKKVGKTSESKPLPKKRKVKF